MTDMRTVREILDDIFTALDDAHGKFGGGRFPLQPLGLISDLAHEAIAVLDTSPWHTRPATGWTEATLPSNDEFVAWETEHYRGSIFAGQFSDFDGGGFWAGCKQVAAGYYSANKCVRWRYVDPPVEPATTAPGEAKE